MCSELMHYFYDHFVTFRSVFEGSGTKNMKYISPKIDQMKI